MYNWLSKKEHMLYSKPVELQNQVINLLICKSQPKHFVCVQYQRFGGWEENQIPNIKFYSTDVLTMKQNRILDILTGNLMKEGRKFDKQQPG